MAHRTAGATPINSVRSEQVFEEEFTLKIVFTIQPRRTNDEFMEELRAEFPGVEFAFVHAGDDQVREIADADALVGKPSAQAFHAARKLRWIHEMGTGIDQYIAVEGLAESDVTLTNALGPHANPMADHVFALLLSLTHCLPELFEDQRARRWEMDKYQDRYVELEGRTMGILGLGGIGRSVARRAHGFGMKVYAVDIRPVDGMPQVDEVWGLDRLDELIKKLRCPCDNRAVHRTDPPYDRPATVRADEAHVIPDRHLPGWDRGRAGPDRRAA